MPDSPQQTVPCVIVVPMNYAGEVLLINDSASDSTELTLPIAVGAAGEAPEQVARRVLLQATGYKAEAIFSLGTLNLSVQIFLARNLEPARSMIDAIYQGTTERVALDDLDALIDSGRVRNLIVLTALLEAQRQVTGSGRADQDGAGDG